MKKRIIGLIFTGLTLLVSAKAHAFDPNFFTSVVLATEAIIVRPSSYTFDTNEMGITKGSGQNRASTVTTPSVTFYDGRVATATITISSLTVLAPATAYNTITVTSNTALAGSFVQFQINGSTFLFKEGRDWTSSNWSTGTPAFAQKLVENDFSTATIVSLMACMNFSSYNVIASTAYFQFSQTPVYFGFGLTDYAVAIVTGPNVGVLRALYAGSAPNAWSLKTSTQFALTAGISTVTASIKLSSAAQNFIFGRDGAVVKIASTTIISGLNWTVQDTASATAKDLSNAITANANSLGVVFSSWAGGVVYVTSTYITTLSTWGVGARVMDLFTSSYTALLISSPVWLNSGVATGTMTGMYSNQIDTVTSVISTANLFTTGMAVLFSTAGAAVDQWAPGRTLAGGTTYFITNRTPNSFQIAHTSTGAFAGVPIAITTTGALGGGVYRLTPIPFNQFAQIKWRYSNNNIDYFDVPGTSFTITNLTLANSATYFSLTSVVQEARYIQLFIQSSSNTPVYLPGLFTGKR